MIEGNGAGKVTSVASKTAEIVEAIRSADLSREQLARLEAEIAKLKGERAEKCQQATKTYKK